MTDISATAQTTIRHLKLTQRNFPWQAIGASINAMPLVVGNALRLAYVDPYIGLGRKPPVVSDDNLEGRDPNW